MNNKSHPDRSAEAISVREELAHNSDATIALNAIARENSSDLEIPPVPDDLRDQWKERYGEAADRTPAPEHTSWLDRIPSFFKLGATTALAALALFLVLRPSDFTAPSSQPFDTATLRGPGTFTPTPDTVTIFIESDHISFQDMVPTRKPGLILKASNLEDAGQVIHQNKLSSAVILQAATGIIYPFPGKAGDQLQIVDDPQNSDQYDLSEALDNYLKK